MKIVRMYDYGGPEVLKLEEAQVPNLGPNEVLVQVKAAGINPLDWKIREGFIKGLMPLPCVLGCDIAGIIEEVDSDVTHFKKGDEIFAMADMSRGGGYAEYITLNAALIAHKPNNLNFEEAAAVPLASLTAWQALFDEAQLQAGQKVLIQAASGGVGSFAVQLAKAKGVYVVGTTSTKHIECVKNLGADEVIDYTQTDFSAHYHDFDVVLDTIGNDVQERSLKCLRKGGILVTLVALTTAEMAERYQVRAIRTIVNPNGERLALIAQMIEDGQLKPVIDRILTLKEVQDAHILSQAGHAKGKIVLRVN